MTMIGAGARRGVVGERRDGNEQCDERDHEQCCLLPAVAPSVGVGGYGPSEPPVSTT